MEGQQGQVYAIRCKLAEGSFGVVYDAVKLMKLDTGQLIVDQENKEQIVVKMMFNCSVNRQEVRTFNKIK